MRKILYNPDTDNMILETIEYFISAIKGVEDEKVYIALTCSEELDEFYENFKRLAKFMEMKFWNKIVLFLATDNKNNSNFSKMSHILFDNFLKRKIITEDQVLDITKEEDLKKIERIDIALLSSDENSCFRNFPKESSGKDITPIFDLIEEENYCIKSESLKKTKFSFLFFVNSNCKEAYLKYKNKNLSEVECVTKYADFAEKNYIITNISTAKELIRVKKLEDINI
jgi:hypothetical protein